MKSWYSVCKVVSAVNRQSAHISRKTGHDRLRLFRIDWKSTRAKLASYRGSCNPPHKPHRRLNCLILNNRSAYHHRETSAWKTSPMLQPSQNVVQWRSHSFFSDSNPDARDAMLVRGEIQWNNLRFGTLRAGPQNQRACRRRRNRVVNTSPTPFNIHAITDTAQRVIIRMSLTY
jgi:hypothetical protein